MKKAAEADGKDKPVSRGAKLGNCGFCLSFFLPVFVYFEADLKTGSKFEIKLFCGDCVLCK